MSLPLMAATSVLIFRIGTLGDTLVALPSLWAIRDHFRDAHLTLLCDEHAPKHYVVAADLLRNSGVVDDFLTYPVLQSRSGRLLRPLRMLGLAMALRRCRFDALVYLPPTGRTDEQAGRDRTFFRLAGIRQCYAMESAMEVPPIVAGSPLPVLAPEADMLLARLQKAGIPVPPPGQGRMDLGLGPAEDANVAAWTARQPPDGGRPWIAVGPGSKMPAKIWPSERYREVVATLIRDRDVWPVVFGGGEDRAVGEQLLAAWGRGRNAAGALDLRASAAAIRRCRLYLGNDTGTMHMAAAVGVRCVALFSSRGHPGHWYPYGPGHIVFRTDIECEGCGLIECRDRGTECLMRIAVEPVTQACLRILRESPTSKERVV